MTCISVSLLCLEAPPAAHFFEPYVYGEITQRYIGIPRCKITDQWDYEVDIDYSQMGPNIFVKHQDFIEGNKVAVNRPSLRRLSDDTVGIHVTDPADIRVDVTEWTQSSRQSFVHRCRIRGNMKFKQERYAEAHRLYCAGLAHVKELDPGPTRDEMQYLLEINGATSAGKAALPYDVREHACRAICLRPEMSKGWYWQGMAQTSLGHFEAARQSLAQAWLLTPGDADIAAAIEAAREKSLAAKMMAAL